MEDGSITPDKTYYFDEHKKLEVQADASEALKAIKEIDDEYIANPLGHFNALKDAMRMPVAPDSPPYAVFKDEDSSTDTALVVMLPFANSLVPEVSPSSTVDALKSEGKIDSNQWHNAEKHYALYKILKAMGVTDAQGRNIPVIAISAPSQDWKPDFSDTEKDALKQGDFAPFSRYIQAILDKEHINQVHIGGYSLGASIGQSAVHNLTNVNVLSATLGEPPNYKKRSALAMFNNYTLNRPAPPNNSGIKSEEKWTISGPQARTDLEAQPNKWMKNLYQQGLENAWVLVGAMGKPGLLKDLEASIKEGQPVPTTIEYGGTSSLTHDIEEHLEGSEVIKNYASLGRLRIVKALGHEAVGAPHLHGESPLFYGLWMAESILWAIEASKKTDSPSR